MCQASSSITMEEERMDIDEALEIVATKVYYIREWIRPHGLMEEDKHVNEQM